MITKEQFYGFLTEHHIPEHIAMWYVSLNDYDDMCQQIQDIKEAYDNPKRFIDNVTVSIMTQLHFDEATMLLILSKAMVAEYEEACITELASHIPEWYPELREERWDKFIDLNTYEYFAELCSLTTWTVRLEGLMADFIDFASNL